VTEASDPRRPDDGDRGRPDLPVTVRLISPALGFGMTLEPAIITALLHQAGPRDLRRRPGQGVPV